MSVQRKYSPDAEFQKVTVSSGSNRFNHFSKYDSESSDSESVYGVVCEEIIEPESEVGLSGERSFEEIYGSDSDDGQITARVGQPVTLTGQYEVGSTSQPQNITVGDTVQMNIGLGGGNGASNYKSDDTTTKQYHVGDNVNVTLNVNDVSDNESNSYSHTQKHDAEPPVIYVDQCSSRNSFTESDSSEPEREEQEFEIILKKSTKIEPSNKKHLKRLMKNSPQHDNSKQASVSLSVNVEQDTDMIPQGREEHQIANNTYMVTQRDERQIVGDTNMISQRQERQIIKDDDPVVFTSVTYQSSDDESIKSYTQFSDDNSSQHSTPNKTRKSTHSFTLSKNRTYSPEIVEFHNRSETPEIFEVQTQIESPEIFQETPSTDISFEQNNDEVDLIVAPELPHHHERRGSMNFLPIDIEVQADPNDSRRCSVIIAPHSDDDDDDIQTKNHYSHFEVKHSEKKSEYSTRRESNTGSLSTATSYETVDYNVDLHDIYKKTKNLSFAKSNVLKQVRMKSMVLQKMRKHALLGTLKSGNRESTPENNRRRSVDSPSVTSHSYKERRQQSENKVSYSRDDKHIEYSRDTKRMEYDNDHHKDYDTGNRRRIDFDDRKSDHHDNRMHFNDDNRHKDLYSDMHNHSRESSIRNNEQQQIRRHSERESQFHSDKKEEIERNSYEAHSTNITEQHSSRETQLHQSSFNSERRDERRISEQTHQRHFGMHDKQRSKSVVNSPFRPNEMGGTFPRSSNRPGFLLSPQPTHPQQIGGIPTHPNQMGGIPSPPNQMGGMPSHPNQMGGMPSHPNQLGGMLSHPNQMGGMPSLPNQMGGMPSHPNQMGGMPSHPNQMGSMPSHPNQMGGMPSNPNQMGGMPSHPNQMGGMPSHPNQMGGMPSHPNQMGGMPSNPNQMGGMPSHPNQMGGMPSHPNQMGSMPSHPNQMGGMSSHPNQMGGMPLYPNQMGGMPSHPNQKYPSHSANNSPSHPKSGMHTPKPRSLSASSTPNMNRRRNSNTPKDSPLSKPPEKPKHKSSNPNAIIRRSDEDSGIKKPESEEDGSKDRSNSLPSFLAKGPWSQVLNVLGQKQKSESTAAQSSSKAKNAFLSARAKMAEQKKQQSLKEQHFENHMASAQLQSQTMSATQQQQQQLLLQQQQQQQLLLQQQQQQQQQYQLQQNSMQSQSMSSSARSRKFSSFGSVVQKAHRATSSSMQHSSQRSKSVRHQSMRNSSHHHQQHHLQKHHSLKSRHEYQRSLHSSSYRNMTERQIRAHSNWKWAIDSVVHSIRESKHVTKHEEKRDEDSIRVEAKGKTIALVFNDEDKIIDHHHDTADQYYFDKNAEVHRNSKTRSKSVHEKSDHQRYLKRSPSFEDFQGKSKLELVREGSKHIPSEIVYYTVCTRYFHPENNDWIANIHRKGRVLVPRDVEHADKCVFWHELFEPDKEEMQVSKIIKQKRRKKHRRSRSAGPSPQMSRKKNDVPVMYGSHLKTEIKNDSHFHSSSSRLENNSFHRHESSMNHSMQTTMVY